MIKKFLVKVAKRLTCKHSEVEKEHYRGFFGYEKFTCSNCGATWNDEVFDKSNYQLDRLNRLMKKIEKGKTKVIELNKPSMDYNDGSLEKAHEDVNRYVDKHS